MLTSYYENTLTHFSSTFKGNKGGTAIRVSFLPPAIPTNDKNSLSNVVSFPGPTTLTFVNAHLAAFDEMVDKRNSDFHELSKRLLFQTNDIGTAFSSPNSSLESYFSKRDGSNSETDLSQTPKSDSDVSVEGRSINNSRLTSIFETDTIFWMVCHYFCVLVFPHPTSSNTVTGRYYSVC
jgi:phosphatidylinositol-bisphosphatase